MAETSDASRYIGYFRDLAIARRFLMELRDRDYKTKFADARNYGYQDYVVVVEWTSAVWEPVILRSAEMNSAEKLEKEYNDGHREVIYD